jgi:hypothetical protein
MSGLEAMVGGPKKLGVKLKKITSKISVFYGNF